MIMASLFRTWFSWWEMSDTTLGLRGAAACRLRNILSARALTLSGGGGGGGGEEEERWNKGNVKVNNQDN